MGTPLAPGLYESIITEALAGALARTPGATQRPLRDGEASRLLGRHLGAYVRRALEAAAPHSRVDLINAILHTVGEHVPDFVLPGDAVRAAVLTAIHPAAMGAAPPGRPTVPLDEAALFVNARQEPSLASELRKELESADRVDLICAFLFWTGYITVRAALADFIQRGGRLRVISTPYRGVTEPRVLADLAALGAEVRIAYVAQTTRLHAKAWLFHRASGFSTAYVGSSNLSKSALHTGLEWNVRLAEADTHAVIDKFRAAFESYWRDPDFAPYEATRFQAALKHARGADALTTLFELRPRPFQREILDQLAAERHLHDRHRNLVVAATGTGKTVVAALDYARLCRPGYRPTLLFVAHRIEILRQARDTFRHATGDGSFGEVLAHNHVPTAERHVFASIASLQRVLADLAPDQFEHVIIDEFHHAQARTYRAVLDHLQPKEWLGLTATPERADGVNVMDLFDGHVAAEVRLWDAIERGLLVPFQYFVLHDGVDLSQVSWRGGRYDADALGRLYTGNDRRAHRVAKAVQDHVADPQAMRALGFCAGVSHAHYMAKAFTGAGVPAAVVTGSTPSAERAATLAALQGDAPDRPRVLFTVDVFNEGVDLPAVDTVLFLRPTESATVFLQQLGRGLRRWAGKRCLTVLDFVGRPRREFRFDRKLRALTGEGRAALARQVAADFPWLPAGCSLQFDRASRELVLDNLQQALGNRKKTLVDELRALGDVDLAGFLRATDLDLTDLYRARSFADLRRAAGCPTPPAGPQEDALARALCRLIHVDDPERLDAWLALITPDAPPAAPTTDRARRLRLMLSTALFGGHATRPDALAPLWAHPALRDELAALLRLRRSQLDHVPPAWAHAAPLSVHGHYTLAEIMAAFDDVRDGRLYAPREGVVFHAASRCNLLFVTLQKDADDYSPSTLYRDYALAPDRFHWQSQSRTRPDSVKGQRHVHHLAQGVTPLLFVRLTRKDDRGETRPYAFLGPARLVSHTGDRPMNIEWQLVHPMGEAVFRAARVVAG